jgi:hypothetical protein
MRKTFQLVVEGKNRDRVVDAVKHEIRKYLKRERRRDLPAGVDFLDFDCRFGLAPESAQPVHLSSLIASVDAVAKEGAASCYVEILAKPGHRKPKPAVAEPDAGLEVNGEA